MRAGFLHLTLRARIRGMTFAVVSAPKSLCKWSFLSPSLQIDLHKVVHSLGAFFFFFFCRLTDLFLVLIYSTLVSEVFCFKQTDDQKTVTCTFKELVFLRIA